MDWAVIIASVVALIGSLVTIGYSKNSAKKSNDTNQKVGELQVQSLDKQRIVENVGTQRIVWINTVRDKFVQFNAIAQDLHFMSFRISENYTVENAEEKLVSYSFELAKIINSIELFLNPNEPYTKFLIHSMSDMRSKASDVSVTYTVFNDQRERTVFAQNVILKAEWRRVKDETDKGRFLKKYEVDEIFEEVGNEMNGNYHTIVMSRYRILD